MAVVLAGVKTVYLRDAVGREVGEDGADVLPDTALGITVHSGHAFPGETSEFMGRG